MSSRPEASESSKPEFLRAPVPGVHLRLWMMISGISLAIVIATVVMWIATGQARDSWHDYRQHAQQREVLIAELESALGYDALIHDFKNLVIRGGDPDRRQGYRQRFLERFEATRRALTRYRMLELTPDETEALRTIEAVVDEYRDNIGIAMQMHAEGASVTEIDAVVKVDDTPASAGLSVLRAETARQQQANSIRIDSNIRTLVSLVATAATLVILAIVVITIQTGRAISRIQTGLRESTARFINLGVASPVGIMHVDRRGRCRYVNPYWSELTGIEDSDALGEGWTRSIHPDDRPEVLRRWRKSLSEQARSTDDFRLKRPDGTVVWVSTVTTPEYDPDGEVIGHITTSTDITQVKTIEAQLRENNVALDEALARARAASEAKTSVLACMSHEIRTPMNGIIGMGTLLDKTSLDPKQRRYLETMLGSASALLGILNDILDISKIESGVMALETIPFDLRPIVQQTAQLFRALVVDKEISLTVDYPPQVPSVFIGDPLRVRQVLANLVGNAVKFTEQGRVTVQVRELECMAGESTLELVVADTGIGIPKQELDRIFEPFVQAESSMSRRRRGTGLGLSISRRLAETMGGTLTAESEVGEGSVFRVRVTLPRTVLTKDEAEAQSVVAARSSPGAPRPPEVSPPSAGPRLLVAEDDATNRLVLTDLLSSYGCEVEAVPDGKQALEAVQDGTYDLVLLDGSMPVMGGLETARAIRELGTGAGTLPIVAISAHAMEGDRQAFIDAGCSDYITKPISVDELVRVLRRYVDIEDE